MPDGLSVNGKFSHITDDDILAVGEHYGIGTALKVLARVNDTFCDISKQCRPF